MDRWKRLLEEVEWVQNRGINWKRWQKTRFALTIIHPLRHKTLLRSIENAITEFIMAEILVEEGRLK